VSVSTNAYAIKRAIFARLAALTGVGEPFEGISISYDWRQPKDTMTIIHGGRVEFDQSGEEDIVGAGPVAMIIYESALIDVHIHVRVAPSPVDGSETTEADAEAIGDALAGVLHTEPAVGGAGTTTRLRGGFGDSWDDDDSSNTLLTFQLQARSRLDGTT